MSAGKFLLYSLLSEEDSKRVTNYLNLKSSGVEEDWFLDYGERKAYNFVTNFYMTHGVLPSPDVVSVETGIYFPQHPLYEPFDYFLGLFKEYYKEVLFTSLLDQINEHHDKDEAELRDAKLRALVEKLNDFDSSGKSVRLLSEVTEENLKRHRNLRDRNVDGGVLFGLPTLDYISGGAQVGDVWVIAGNSGSGKSYVTCRMAMAAVLGRCPEQIFDDLSFEHTPQLDFLFNARPVNEDTKPVVTWPRKRVLYISMEMTNSQIGLRDASLGSRVSGTDFRLGRLPEYSITLLNTFMDRWKDWDLDDKLILVEGSVNMTVQDVIVKIKEYRPDVVFIDGAYMLRTVRGSQKTARWETIVDVTDALKKTAMAESIPIILTFQFDQKAKEQSLATIMGGQAIGQIASVAIGLSDCEGSDADLANMAHKELTILKGRNGEMGTIKLCFDMHRSAITEAPGGDLVSELPSQAITDSYIHDEDLPNLGAPMGEGAAGLDDLLAQNNP